MKHYGSKENLQDTHFIQLTVNSFLVGEVPKLNYMYDLYKGEHDILDRQVSENKPNNRLVNDFYGHIIDTTTGYFLGKPIIITAPDDKTQEALDGILNDNEKDDLLMEIGKEMCIKGKSALMVYQDEQSETRLARIPAQDVIFVYDQNSPNTVVGAIRLFYVQVVTSANAITQRLNLEVYTDTETTYYSCQIPTNNVGIVGNGYVGTLVLDTTRKVNPVKNIYGYVPIIPFINNEEEMSDIEKIITLVDDFDRVFSDASNEHEAYRNAYLMIKNMTMGSDTLAKLKEEGIIEVMEDGDVKFITKDVPTEAVKQHLDRLKDNIYKFANTPDLSDENFAGNLSGVAIKFKLFGLETKCIIKERKFNRALKQLIRVLSVPLKLNAGAEIKPSDLQIQFTRNIPANIVEITDVVSKLQGIVDKETLLSLLPFVDNPSDILEKLQEEQDSYSQDIQQANNTMGDTKSPFYSSMMDSLTAGQDKTAGKGNTAGQQKVDPTKNPTKKA